MIFVFTILAASAFIFCVGVRAMTPADSANLLGDDCQSHLQNVGDDCQSAGSSLNVYGD